MRTRHDRWFFWAFLSVVVILFGWAIINEQVTEPAYDDRCFVIEKAYPCDQPPYLNPDEETH